MTSTLDRHISKTTQGTSRETFLTHFKTTLPKQFCEHSFCMFLQRFSCTYFLPFPWPNLPPPHPNRQTFGLALASNICRYLPCFVCSLPLCWLVFFLSFVFYRVLLYLPLSLSVSLSLSGSLNSLLEPFAASNRGCALGCFTLQITGLDWKA